MAMRLTAGEQLALGVIDEVVPEPVGGAHTNPEETARRLRARIAAHLDSLAGRDRRALLDARYARYRNMGEFAVAAETGETQPQRPGIVNRIRRLLDTGRNALVGGEGEAPAADEDASDEVNRTGEGM